MIETWKSTKPCNPIAPDWEFKFWSDNIFTIDECVEIKDYILKNETSILESFPNPETDGGTGLGINSLTSRFNFINIFSWNTKFAKKLKSKALLAANALLKEYQFNQPIYGQCWANVMREGEQIQPHWHSSFEHSFLGGHVSIQTNFTHTYYENPFNKNDIKSFLNLDGNLTVFPNYLVHWTDQVTSSEPRITLAFDLLTEDAIKSQQEHTKNFIKL